MSVLIAIICLALAFDFVNGFHDAPNSVATIVAARVLTPIQAVVWAAFFNFVSFFIAKYIIGEFGIADTMSKIIDIKLVANPSQVMISALAASIFWNLITWLFGIPSSSSHTLIGGLAGAAIAAAGLKSIHAVIIGKIALFMFMAPFIGFVGGVAITLALLHLMKNVKPSQADRYFKHLQLISSACLSIGHGLNDSQKVMGIIATTLMAASISDPHLNKYLYMTSMEEMHDWIPVACFMAISLGTLFGGQKIMKTMGNKITKIYSFEGFAAQTAGAVSLFVSEALHIPVSTTHVMSGSIIGVGSVKRLSAVRWGVTRSMMTAWILTIPVTAILGGLLFELSRFVF